MSNRGMYSQSLEWQLIKEYLVLRPLNEVGYTENLVFNMTSLSGRNTDNSLINSHSRICECMPLITTELVGPEVRKNGY